MIDLLRREVLLQQLRDSGNPVQHAFFEFADTELPFHVAAGQPGRRSRPPSSCVVATHSMSALFVFGLQLAHAGLALSIGLAACLNSVVLYYQLRKRDIYRPEPGWTAFFFKLGCALLALGLTLWFGMGSEQHWLNTHGWARILHLAALVIGGVVVYFTVLFALGFRLRDFARRGAN